MKANNLRIIGLPLLAIGALFTGCTNTAPLTGTYSAEIKPTQLDAGQRHELELTVHYRLNGKPDAPLPVTYKAQLTAPQDLEIEAITWNDSQILKTTVTGFNHTRKIAVTIPAGASGEREIELTLTPNDGESQVLILKIHVMEDDN